jgi:uncharacterized integral membrane protein
LKQHAQGSWCLLLLLLLLVLVLVLILLSRCTVLHSFVSNVSTKVRSATAKK